MDHREKSRSPAVVVLLVVLVVLLPILYVLSIGPASWMCDTGYLDQDLARRVYLPLIVLHNAVPPIGNVLESYVELFSPAAPPPAPVPTPAVPVVGS